MIRDCEASRIAVKKCPDAPPASERHSLHFYNIQIIVSVFHTENHFHSFFLSSACCFYACRLTGESEAKRALQQRTATANYLPMRRACGLLDGKKKVLCVLHCLVFPSHCFLTPLLTPPVFSFSI